MDGAVQLSKHGDHDAETAAMAAISEPNMAPNGPSTAPENMTMLPIPQPLSHSHFLVEPFQASAFLLTRKHILLDDMRAELRQHLATLRQELVAIINNDYEDFINLGGSHLLGSDDQMAVRMRRPLEGISTEIRDAKDELLAIRSILDTRLQKREEIRTRKAVCRKLLAVNEQLGKVEDMLRIARPAAKDGSVSKGQSSQASATAMQKESNAAIVDKCPYCMLVNMESNAESYMLCRVNTSSVKHIERTAQEYSHLLYLAARSDTFSFVGSLQPRIVKVTTTILQELADLLVSCISAQHRYPTHTSGAKPAQVREDALADCLRIYASIGRYREAEDVVRRHLVAETVNRIIYREALLSPQSPMMPITPFPHTGSIAGILSSTGHTSSFPFKTGMTTSDTLSLLTDEKHIPTFYHVDPIPPPAPSSTIDISISNALVDMYNRLLAFVSKDLSNILEVAERRPACGREATTSRALPHGINLISNGTAAGDESMPGSPNFNDRHVNGHTPSTALADIACFAFLSNVVFDAIATRLTNELSHLIFSAGRPETFHRNYVATCQFIDRLEGLCPNARYLAILRSSRAYTSFLKRWQLPVYFQLRFKEIAGQLESLLRNCSTTAAPAAVQSNSLLMLATDNVYRAIWTSWNDDVFLPELAGKFWKLTLQFIGRYKVWLETNMPEFRAMAKPVASNAAVLSGASATGSIVGLNRLLPGGALNSRPSTPTPGGTTSASSTDDTADEASLRQFSTVIADASTFEQLVLQYFSSTIQTKLPKSGEGSLPPIESFETTIRQSLSSVTDPIASLVLHIVGIVSKRCAEPLRLVRSGASQVRGNQKSRSGDTLEPSYFVANILRPARAYIDGPGKVLSSTIRNGLLFDVFEDIASRYEAALSKMKRDGDALRRLKRGRQGFQLFGSRTATASNESAVSAEDEQVKMQMTADIEAFAADASALGVDVSASAAFSALRNTVDEWTR